MKTASSDRLLTTAEAARILGLHRSRVQALAKSGQLKAQKHGRDYLIRAADLASVERRPVGRPRKEREG